MIILITGSGSGIGKAAAEYFLARGHEVHGVDILPGAVDCGKISPAGVPETGKYFHYIADITKDEGLPAGLLPDILVNCAGVQNTGRDIDVNLKGTIRITERYALQNDRIRAVVTIGSSSAHTGSEFPEYAASKGGLIAYTRNVALRLAPRATCNSIDPGGVTTDLNRCVMDDPELWRQIMDQTPMKRWASPEEIAEWVYFVAVNNRFMTGQNLLIDGGEAGWNRFIWPEEE